MTKPTGLLQVDTVVPGPPSQLAATATIVVRDAAGFQWCFPATYFAYDLKPYAASQSLDFLEWKGAVNAGLFPRYHTCPEADHFDFESAYRSGIPPESAARSIINRFHSAWPTEMEEGEQHDSSGHS